MGRCTLPAGDTQPDYATLSQILAKPTDDTPVELLEALFLIDEVSHGPNIELLLKDVEKFSLFMDVEEGASPADIAVQVYLLDPQVLRRRHSMLVLDRVRTYESFRAGVSLVPGISVPDEEALRGMAQSMDSWFDRKRKGIGTRILCTESSDWLCLAIRHGDLLKREGAVATDGGDDKVLYRPERYDAVAYHRQLGELRINGRTKGEKDLYRRVIGTHLFGDEEFFPKTQTRYTLDPLRFDGKASLACLDVEGIERITLRRLVFNWGGKRGEIETREADDLFALYEEKGDPFPPEPEIRSATFEIKFTDSKRPRRVTLRPPNIASFTRDGDSPLVEEWLRKRDFVVRGALGDGITLATFDSFAGSQMKSKMSVGSSSRRRIENNPLRAGLKGKIGSWRGRVGTGEPPGDGDRMAEGVKTVRCGAFLRSGRAWPPVFAAMLIRGVRVRGRAGGPNTFSPIWAQRPGSH